MVTSSNEAFDLDQGFNMIVRMLSDGKREWRRIVDEMGKIGSNLEKLTDRVYQIEDWSRKPFPTQTTKLFIEVVQKYFNGMCPCCGEIEILNKLGGKNEKLEIDHFKSPKWNNATEGWTICHGCHAQHAWLYSFALGSNCFRGKRNWQSCSSPKVLM